MQVEDTDVIDDIQIVYDVQAICLLAEGKDKEPLRIEMGFAITCGVYDGQPTKKMICDLIMSRGIYADDLSVIMSKPSASRAQLAEMIMEAGLKEANILSMKILEVSYKDRILATSSY